MCELSTYHFRYRICNVHIRLPAFMRQGRLQRFCQQCGRCHELSEFEGNQRSCRAQLDRHNARCCPTVAGTRNMLHVPHCSAQIGMSAACLPATCMSVVQIAAWVLQGLVTRPCRRRQAKKNAQAAKSGAAGHSVLTSASQPLSSVHQAGSASREAPRAYSADLEHYQRARAIRPVGKLGQVMPAAEAAALLTAVGLLSGLTSFGHGAVHARA